MGKAPSEEELCCSPRLSLVILNPGQHSTKHSKHIPTGCYWQEMGQCFEVQPLVT